jgi:hypothetical protein
VSNERWAYAGDLSKGGDHAQTPKESADLGAAATLSRALENTNCEALQRGGATSGEGGDASDPSKNERRRRNVQRNQTVRYDVKEDRTSHDNEIGRDRTREVRTCKT